MPLEERTARLTILIDPRKKAVFERLCAEEDVTPSQVLRRLMRRFRKHGGRVLLCGVHSRLAETLRSGGVLELVGEQNVCTNMRDVSRLLA